MFYEPPMVETINETLFINKSKVHCPPSYIRNLMKYLLIPGIYVKWVVPPVNNQLMMLVL